MRFSRCTTWHSNAMHNISCFTRAVAVYRGPLVLARAAPDAIATAGMGFMAASRSGDESVHRVGILMAASGMAAYLARTLAGTGTAYLAAAPFVGAMGGFITGSNSGANAMFAATQAEIARSLGVDVLWFMAVHNVAAAFLLMGSPGKIEMAIRLSPAEAADHRRWCQMTILLVALTVVAILAAIIVIVGGR